MSWSACRHTGTTDTVAVALDIARENGATTIAITSDANSPVAKAAHVVLTTWNSSTPSIPLYGDFLEGRISQLFLIDLLYLGLLFRLRGQDLEASQGHRPRARETLPPARRRALTYPTCYCGLGSRKLGNIKIRECVSHR